MKHLIIVLAFITSLIPLTTNSVQTTEPILSTYQVFNVEESNMKIISEKFEVIRKVPNGFEVLVPADQSQELAALAPNYKMIALDSSHDLKNLALEMPKEIPNGLRQYQLYNQIVDRVKKLESQNPNLVQFVEYGKSADGRVLFAVKISDNVTVDEEESEVMITAATHGDEIITAEIAMGLIEKMIDGYNGNNQRFQSMINGREIYFIPVVNVDGFVNRTRYDKGRDPNRSYPYPENPNVDSTPSIAALINFFKSRNFAGSLDFHAYGEMTMYPWAYTYDSVPQDDRKIFDDLAKRMAQTNNYTYGPISEVIYVAKGSSADYYYWTKQTIALAIEVGSSKAPSPNQIENYTRAQEESTWIFIENF